jgi:hypothetical protein
MKSLIFKHYLRRLLKDPMGLFVITGLPAALIVILTMVMKEEMPEGAQNYRGEKPGLLVSTLLNDSDL